MQNINVALVQSDLRWEDKKSNLLHFNNLIAKIPSDTDLILLPEMFTTAFTMNPDNLAEEMDGNAVLWMKDKAKETHSVISGSLIIKENKNYYNRLIWMRPDGSYEYYDKRHLFTYAGEDKHYTSGSRKITVELNDWKLCPLICYDLRFPVWIRNKENYDCLVFVANWPESRISQWENMLISRAIENQCYVVAVNRIGYDKAQLYFNGHSMIIGPTGKILMKATEHETIMNMSLPNEVLTHTRQNMQFLRDRDEFSILSAE